MTPFEILAAKRRGESLEPEQIAAVIAGASDGSWSDAQLGAFLTSVTIHGLDEAETAALTTAMVESGEQWRLRDDFPQVVDKHSTGGVGDKVTLIAAPLLASCGVQVAKLTGRGLGHTGGTADKLECVPGFRLDMDRARCCRLLDGVGVAIGIASSEVAPADRRLYALRNLTATVESVPLVAGSILSKKLALGCTALAFDVKTGSGAFFTDLEDARALARLMVDTCGRLGCRAGAVLTDMSQPLGRWAGHAMEWVDALECLRGSGEPRLLEVALAVAGEILSLLGESQPRLRLERQIASGEALETLGRWLEAQGGDRAWLDHAEESRAPVEIVARADRDGVLAEVATRELGLLLLDAGAGRKRAEDSIDIGVSLLCECQLGDAVAAGQELARLYVRTDRGWQARLQSCFRIADESATPPAVLERIR